MSVLTLALALCAAGVSEPEPAAEPEATESPPEPLDERVSALEQRVREGERMVVERQPRWTLGGYVDLGFFLPQGNGAGFVQDVGPAGLRHFPQHAGRNAWVFLGDVLAPAINTRGEPADLGDAPDTNRLDAIDSNGAPGFIANEVHLALRSAVAANAAVTASVNFAPRSGADFRLGDTFDVDRAELEWMIGRSRRTSIFVGKTDPVFGIEYRERKSDQRFGITPSLIARYTSGTPLGLKVRSKLGSDDLIVLAAAVTNGSSGIEMFHFHDEIDSNAGKTGSARVAVAPSLSWPVSFELGLSGEIGAQDRARDSRHAARFVGIDLQVRHRAVLVKGQWLRGEAHGEDERADEPTHRPFGLRLRHGGYLEVDLVATRMFGFWARAELRDALVWLGNPDAPEGAERLYVTKSWRATAGVRAILTPWAVAKAEYLRNGEYGGVPAIRNDIFTTSLVLMY